MTLRSPLKEGRPELGHRARVQAALADLPVGLDWLGNARFGAGVRDI